MVEVESVYLNGLKVYPFKSTQDILDFINEQNRILVSVNAERIIDHDQVFTQLLEDHVGYADGEGAVLALRRKGIKSPKIAGCELWLDIIEQYQHQKSFYIIGAKPAVLKATIDKLKTEFPDMNLLGYRDGYFNAEEEAALVEKISVLKPDVVFVATGSPHQELLTKKMYNLHPAVYLGLGGSFDVYSGALKRAPVIFRKLKLEWLYRVLQQPSRLPRQLVHFKYLYHLIRNSF